MQNIRQADFTREESNIIDFEDQFTDPVTLERFVDPVITNCGHTFSKSVLLELERLERGPSCPLCRRKITNSTSCLVFNEVLKKTERCGNKYLPLNRENLSREDLNEMRNFAQKYAVVDQNIWNRNREEAEKYAGKLSTLFMHNRRLGNGNYVGLEEKTVKKGQGLIQTYQKGGWGKAWDGFGNFIFLNIFGHNDTCRLRKLTAEVAALNLLEIACLER
ncbi:MAG: U-box domain-containing protein [Candidatus Algichlamydia australiensis]|nr:U-box domain-containing protein [Chlamydiales bacterium]